jgi:hypothetical protein
MRTVSSASAPSRCRLHLPPTIGEGSANRSRRQARQDISLPGVERFRVADALVCG